ncbi:MAG: hypothetical protein AB1778_05470 [Candidatus Bipolaricaulota bacterium]
MKRALVALILVSVVAIPAVALRLGSISLGFHLIPAVEAPDGKRPWDLSLSFGFGVFLSASGVDRLEFLAMIDSKPSALGTTLSYSRSLTPSFATGGGLTVLWPFEGASTLSSPLFEAFARVDARGTLAAGLDVLGGACLPVITVAETEPEHWDVLPLADLPSLNVGADVRLVERGTLRAQLTLQPVFAEVDALDHPIGRVTSHLLVLPMASAFLDYVP